MRATSLAGRLGAAAIVLGIGAFGLSAGAQPMDHSGHGAPAASAADSPAVAAYKAAAADMHKQMDIAYSGDPDVDFVRGMIPHHAGALAMAKIVLAHGKDPQIRKLAEEVVKAQQAEIAFMQGWLARHPAK